MLPVKIVTQVWIQHRKKSNKMSDDYNLDGTVENKRNVLAQINDQSGHTTPSHLNLNSSMSSSETDPFATDGDSDVSFSPLKSSNRSSSSGGSSESELDVEIDKNKKRKMRMKQQIKQKKKKTDHPKKCVRRMLLKMNDDLIALSTVATKLEEEIALNRDLPYVKVSTTYTLDAPPLNHLGTNSKMFASNGISVTIPTKTVSEALQLNEILKEKKIFEDVVSDRYFHCITSQCDENVLLFQKHVHISKIYGSNKQRVSWTMTRRVLEALMDKKCLSEFTWTGKTSIKGLRREPIKNLRLVHDLVIATLDKIDSTYTYTLFKSDMVEHIVKYANIRGKKE